MPKIANIQLNSQDNIDNNLIIIQKSVHAAKHGGADLVVLPENACIMGPQGQLANRFHEMVDFYQPLAQNSLISGIGG